MSKRKNENEPDEKLNPKGKLILKNYSGILK